LLYTPTKTGDSAENFLGVLDKSSSTVDIRKVIPKDKYDEKWIIYLIEGNSKFDDNLLNIKNKYLLSISFYFI